MKEEWYEGKKEGMATLFIKHFSYMRQTQSASHRNIVTQYIKIIDN